ncbi:MAG: hypothetical protein WA484_05350 [Solirubrobacteraceae bacterium]
MANSQDGAPSQHPDLLAAVVLHTLVTEGREGFTPARVALACERDPNTHADMEETEAALTLLVDDGLAECEDGLYRPTRAAVRAGELSF